MSNTLIVCFLVAFFVGLALFIRPAEPLPITHDHTSLDNRIRELNTKLELHSYRLEEIEARVPGR